MKLPSKHDGESDEEYEDRCINVLIKALEGFKYDGHPVTAVHVPSNTNEVEIGGEKYANNFFKEDEAAKVQDIMDDDKMTREKLRSHEPTVAEYLRIIFHHMQTTAHGYVIRVSTVVNTVNLTQLEDLQGCGLLFQAKRVVDSFMTVRKM